MDWFDTIGVIIACCLGGYSVSFTRGRAREARLKGYAAPIGPNEKPWQARR